MTYVLERNQDEYERMRRQALMWARRSTIAIAERAADLIRA